MPTHRPGGQGVAGRWSRHGVRAEYVILLASRPCVRTRPVQARLHQQAGSTRGDTRSARLLGCRLRRPDAASLRSGVRVQRRRLRLLRSRMLLSSRRYRGVRAGSSPGSSHPAGAAAAQTRLGGLRRLPRRKGPRRRTVCWARRHGHDVAQTWIARHPRRKPIPGYRDAHRRSRRRPDRGGRDQVVRER